MFLQDILSKDMASKVTSSKAIHNSTGEVRASSCCMHLTQVVLGFRVLGHSCGSILCLCSILLLNAFAK